MGVTSAVHRGIATRALSVIMAAGRAALCICAGAEPEVGSRLARMSKSMRRAVFAP